MIGNTFLMYRSFMDVYVSPLTERYASEEMKHIFSPDFKFGTWRRLWVALAEAEQSLGIEITDGQIEEMRSKVDDIDYDFARQKESEVRHDVMAHVLTFGEQCKSAKPIIHLGATSCFVGDNTDLCQMKSALHLVRKRLLLCIKLLRDFAIKHKDLATLAYTHFQPAQPTTVGKRATLWLLDLVTDLQNLDFQLENMQFLGCKGTTGTSASFLELFAGDYEKVKKLDRMIAEKMGFDKVCAVSGQTYSRKTDFNVLSVLSSIAQSATKFSNDIRLLSHEKEVEEPFESKQIGSSAMAYKRNPMRSERMASLARYVICDLQNTAITASNQWLERTLDDSANKRIAIPEAFLAIDAILALYANIIGGLTVYPCVIAKNLDRELPFMATENILMYCVKNRGKDRQVLHEAIRRHSVDVAKNIKLNGGENDLLSRIANDEVFGLTKDELHDIVNGSIYVGCAPWQVEEFIKNTVNPLLEINKADIGDIASINV